MSESFAPPEGFEPVGTSISPPEGFAPVESTAIAIPQTFSPPQGFSPVAAPGQSRLPRFIQEGYNRSLTGLADQIVNDKKRFDLSGYELSTVEDIAATVASFLMLADFLLTIGTGGIASIAARSLAKSTAAQLVKSGIKSGIARKVAVQGATRAIQGASVVGVYSGAESALAQQAEFGEIDLGEVVKATLRGTIIGGIAGGTGGALAGRGLPKAVEVGGEITAFGTAGPATEGRLPTFEDYIHGAGVILGLRAVHATTSAVRRGLRQSIAEDIRVEVEAQGASLEDAIETVGRKRAGEIAEIQVRLDRRANTLQAFRERNLEIKKLQQAARVELEAAIKAGEESRALNAQLSLKELKGLRQEAQAEITRLQQAGEPKTPVLPEEVLPPEIASRVEQISKESPVTDIPGETPRVETGGVIPIGALNISPSATRAFFQKNFTSRGNLPVDVFAKKVFKEAAIGAELKQSEFIVRDLGRALKNNPVAAKVLSSALKGNIDINTLPEPVRAPVARMRDHIDTLSRRMIEEGVVEGDMAAVVTNDLETYITRTYRIFDDPLWSKKITPDVRNKAKVLFRKEYMDTIDREYVKISGNDPRQSAREMETVGTDAWKYREQRVEGVLENLLFEGKASDSPIAMIRRGNLGSKDLSILSPRKPIAPEIRALFGEQTDPIVNYTTSVSKMAHLIENQKFLSSVRTDGLGTFLHEQPIVKNGVQYKTRISADGSDVMAPLNGLFTTPEIRNAFKDAMDPVNSGPMLSAYMKVNGTVKFAKTVGSIQTHVRNVLGNIGFAVANGHFRVGKTGDAFKIVMTSLVGGRELRTPKQIKTDAAKGAPPTFQDRYLKYQRLGVVNESARAGELQDVIKDARSKDVAQFSNLNAVQRGAEKVLKVATSTYRAEDDVWKIYAFENEVARYSKAIPEAPPQQIDALAADIVRNTYPTYSLVPQGVKNLRRFPLVGTFVSFPAEVIRTTGNMMRLMTQEISSPNPRIRVIGAQRLAGMIVAMTATAGMAGASRFIAGMTKQDDTDAREFMPPWSKNSDVIWVGESEGNRTWIDISYTDPYSYLKKPLQAFLRGETWEDKIVNAGLEAMEPFLGEEILSGAITDVARNTTETGGRVYNPEAPWNEIALDAISHVGQAFTPGTINSINRIQKGLRGIVTPWGRKYDPKIEALATFSGTRINSLDVNQGLSFKARDFTRRIRDANSLITGVLKNRGEVSPEQITEAYRNTELSRREIFAEMGRAAFAARALGQSEREVFLTLKGNGLSKVMARDVMRGIYRPYIPQVSSDIPLGRQTLVRQLSRNVNVEAGR